MYKSLLLIVFCFRRRDGSLDISWGDNQLLELFYLQYVALLLSFLVSLPLGVIGLDTEAIKLFFKFNL